MIALFSRIFVAGFYQQYSGLFLLIGLLFVGLCPPGEHWRIFLNLALATVTYWQGLCIIMLISVVYQYLIVQYIRTTIYLDAFRFLKYSLLSFSFTQRLSAWTLSLTIMSLPMLSFLIAGIYMGIWQGELAFAIILLMWTGSIFCLSHYLVFQFTDPLRSRESKFLWTDWGSRLGSSYMALGIRFLLSEQRLPYFLAKLLSYAFITVLFFVYNDIKEHQGVAMIVLTSIAMPHIPLLAGQFNFERQGLRLWRNLPYHKSTLWLQVFSRIVLILLPESLWLFYRYPWHNALLYIAYLLSFCYFLYHLYFLFPKNQLPGRTLFFLYLTLLILSPLFPIAPLIAGFLIFSAVVYWVHG